MTGNAWRRLACLTILILAARLAAAAPNAPTKVDFINVESLDEAKKKAKKEDKNLLVVIISRSCPWCKLMMNNIMSDPCFALIVNELCLSVLADQGTDAGKKIGAEFSEQGVPRVYVLSPDGEQLDFTSGTFGDYQAEHLDRILAGIKPDKARLTKLEKKLKKFVAENSKKGLAIQQAHMCALVYWYMGDLKKADKIYDKKALARTSNLNEKNAYAWFWGHDAQSNLKEALAVAKECAAGKRNPWFLYTLAECHFALKQYPEAVKAMEEAVALPKGDSARFKEALEKYRSAAGGK